MLAPSPRLGAAVALALSVFPLAANAGVIIPSNAVAAPVPGTPGTGLFGKIWDYAAGDIAEARLVTQTQPASAGFNASLLDYPNGAAPVVVAPGSVGEFLSVDAGSLTGTVRGDASVFGKIFIFSGFIAIAQPGLYTFTVGSDDGFGLNIGGQSVAEFSDSRRFGFSSGDATFSAPGLYPVELFYWANAGGESGLQFESTVFGGLSYGNSGVAGSGLVPTPVLYTNIPAPGSASLALFGTLLLARRRR